MILPIVPPLLGSLAGTIFYDDENDDLYTGDAGVSGQVVSLINGSGVVVATGETDANGDYLFTGLVADSYTVSYENSSTYTDDSLMVVTINGNPVGTASGIQMLTSITLGAGEDSSDNDFGLILL